CHAPAGPAAGDPRILLTRGTRSPPPALLYAHRADPPRPPAGRPCPSPSRPSHRPRPPTDTPARCPSGYAGAKPRTRPPTCPVAARSSSPTTGLPPPASRVRPTRNPPAPDRANTTAATAF